MVADPGGQAVSVLPVHGRKLIAVVYADMAGYSRLIGLDDAGTFERLRELRRDLIDPAIARHGGTLVNTAGDSLLVTFESIIPAVRFAVDVQRGVPDFDGDYAADRRIRFRMGVNVGDVIPDGTNLHGDGVNVAARLQTVCPPGAICVSRIVRDHIGNRLGFGFRDLGAIGLKNIARPTEAFVLELAPPAATSPRRRWLRPTWALLVTVLACAAAAAVVGAIEMTGLALRRNPPPPVEAQSTPPRLSIAVLPFSGPSNDADIARLADGITEDLTTDLAELSHAIVSPLQGALRFKDQPTNAQEVGQKLNVRYVLRGSLRRLGVGVRANVALIASETGGTLWVDRLDVAMADSAMDQEEIAGWLRNSVGRQIIRVEAERSARERPDHPDAVDLMLQARAVEQEQPSRQRTIQALSLYEQALHLDPTSVWAMTGLADAILQRYARFGQDITAADLDHAKQLTVSAEAVAPMKASVLWLRAELLRVQQRWPEAGAAFERVLSLYPHLDSAVQLLGICKLQLGRSEDAIPLFQQVIRDDPRSPGIWVPYLRMGEASLYAGQYDEAVRWIQRSLAADPELPGPNQGNLHALMASSLALAGHLDQAREEAVQASSLSPFLTSRSFMAGLVTNEMFAAQIERVREGLRLAGLRDHVDGDADFGIEPGNRLRTETFGKTPLTVPGATTIRTSDLAALLRDARPVVIDASAGNQTLVGANNLHEGGLGGTLDDSTQNRLRPLMAKLTGGDPSRPIVTLGINAERWTGYNLALRLVALGYRNVYWYRGGREAWEVAGLPMGRAQMTELAAQ